MSMCRARLRNTCDALTLRMSGEQIRLLQDSPKLFGKISWTGLQLSIVSSHIL